MVDLRSLAAFRMLLGAFVVFDLCYRWPELDVWLTDDGVAPRAEWLQAEAGAVTPTSFAPHLLRDRKTPLSMRRHAACCHPRAQWDVCGMGRFGFVATRCADLFIRGLMIGKTKNCIGFLGGGLQGPGTPTATCRRITGRRRT